MHLFGCLSHKGGELRSGVPMSRLSLSQGSAHLSHNILVQRLEPQWWRAATWESLCTCSGARATKVASYDQGCPCPKCLWAKVQCTWVTMYLFKGSNHNGGELRLESRYVPVRVLEPQRWRVAIRGAQVQIVTEPRVGAPESQCTCSSARATTVASCDQGCPCPDCLWAKGQRTWVAMSLLMVPMAWLSVDRLRRPTLLWPCMV